MPVSAEQQATIQSQIDSATPKERNAMKNQAEAHLRQISLQRGMTQQLRAKFDWEIEILARLDATSKEEGEAYLSKRRTLLNEKYL